MLESGLTVSPMYYFMGGDGRGIFENHSLNCKWSTSTYHAGFSQVGKKLNPVFIVMTPLVLHSCSKKSIGRAADKSFGKAYIELWGIIEASDP